MPKLTLLSMTQSILSDMTSDEVNSISDTIEAGQVASIIKDTYYAMIKFLKKIPEHYTTGTLTALGDTAHPNYMQIPASVLEVQLIKYNTATDGTIEFTDIVYMKPEDFLKLVLLRNSSSTDIQQITDFGGAKLLIQNDKMPQWYTSFDNNYIVFDSYNNTIESTLQAINTLCYFKSEPAWSATDTFIPNLDSELFPLLLAEAKSTCFADLKQTANPKVEQVAKRQLTSTQANKHRERKPLDNRPDFGRK